MYYESTIIDLYHNESYYETHSVVVQADNDALRPLTGKRPSRGGPGAAGGGRADRRGTDRALDLSLIRSIVGFAPVRHSGLRSTALQHYESHSRTHYDRPYL